MLRKLTKKSFKLVASAIATALLMLSLTYAMPAQAQRIDSCYPDGYNLTPEKPECLIQKDGPSVEITAFCGQNDGQQLTIRTPFGPAECGLPIFSCQDIKQGPIECYKSTYGSLKLTRIAPPGPDFGFIGVQWQ